MSGEVTTQARGVRSRNGGPSLEGDGELDEASPDDVIDAVSGEGRAARTGDDAASSRSASGTAPARTRAPSSASRSAELAQVATGDLEADESAGVARPDDDALPENERDFGPYLLLRRLAFGGMGEVFLACHVGEDPATARHFVIKRVLNHMRRDEKQRRLFLDEARLQSRLVHPHVVGVDDVGEINGHVFLAMEHVHGPSWRSVVARCRKRKQHIPLSFIVDMMIEAAQGLGYAHSLVDKATGQPLRIVHRDVNPHNVLVTYDGVVKLIDFGIAKSELREQQTETGTIKGKFAYMSPEQSAAEPLDGRSDLFALGICLYELITLTNPFRRSNIVLSLEAIQKHTPRAIAELRPGARILGPVVERMLAKDPDDRFATCEEVAAALLQLRGDGVIPKPPKSLSAWMHELFADELALHARILEEARTSLRQQVRAADAPLRDDHDSAHDETRSRLVVRSATGNHAARARSSVGSAVGSATGSASLRALRDDTPNTGHAAPLTPRIDVLPDNVDDAPAAIGGAERSASTTRAATPAPARTGLLAAALGVTTLVFFVGAWALLRRNAEAPIGPPPHVDAGMIAAVPPTTVPSTTFPTTTVPSTTVPTTTAADAGVIADHVDAGAAGTAVDAGAIAAAPIDALGGAIPTREGDAGVVAIANHGKPHVDKPTDKGVEGPVDVEAPEVLYKVAVSADGFVVSGKRQIVRGATTTLAVTDADAPYRVKLLLRADNSGTPRLSLESEPWAIVRLNGVGKGRTPLPDLVVEVGRKASLTLQNPDGRTMEVAVTVSSP